MFRNRIVEKIKIIKNEITLAGSLGLEMLDKSLESLQKKDKEKCQEVIEKLEPQMNDLEIDIEKKCINILAIYKLQVVYLRSIAMFFKMNADLERIGDLCSGIAVCSKNILNENVSINTNFLEGISSKTYEILLKVNQAIKNEDAFMAHEVLKMDSEINRMRDEAIKNILNLLKKTPELASADYELIKVVQKLERIGDLSKNLAEDVIYIVSGELLKHGKKQ